jgi:hypothetical protein
MSTDATKEKNNYFWILDQNRYLYAPSRSFIEKAAVARQLGNEPAMAVERERVCSNITWMPGEPAYIADKIFVDGELEDFPGNNLFNMYKPPRPLSENADPDKAAFWLDLGKHIFGDDLDRLLDCLAFKVQFPGRKVNRGFVLGSKEHGIGKDAFIVATKRAVGSANWRIKSATGVVRGIEKDFTPFLQSTILQISEVHELGEKRFGFYDSMKDWMAAPPKHLTVADKNVKEHPISNAVLVLMTSNHLTDGLYIPPEDRRVDYIWSLVSKADLSKLTKLDSAVFWDDYFDRIENRGDSEHVAAFLRARDLSNFKPGAEPPKTEAWKQAVSVNRPAGDADLNDLLDKMAHDWVYVTGEICLRPPALTLAQIRRHKHCPLNLAKLIDDQQKGARQVPHRLGSADYVSFDNPSRKDGYWTINDRRQVIYVWSKLTSDEKIVAAEALVRAEEMSAEERTRPPYTTATGTTPEEDFA